MKLSLHEYQHTMSLEIKCNIDPMKPQHEIMHWERVFQTLFPSSFTYMAILETTITAFGRLELEWCERKILLGWLELELVAGVV